MKIILQIAMNFEGSKLSQFFINHKLKLSKSFWFWFNWTTEQKNPLLGQDSPSSHVNWIGSIDSRWVVDLVKIQSNAC